MQLRRSMSAAVPSPQTREPEAVRAMFSRVARRYDLANHLLSGGLDFWWRWRAAAIVGSWQPQQVLDLATGSGDLALALQKKIPEAEVTGVDFSPEMLAVARKKGLMRTVTADALHLPFADASFDAVTVAFGLRNMADWGAAVKEMARVLRSNGKLLVLDFSLPEGRLGSPYRFYLRRCLPRLASIITEEKSAYNYLGDSIEHFPRGETMCRLLRAHGFTETTTETLSGGIVAIYCGEKS